MPKDYERSHQENGMSFKSRYQPFAPGGFEKWIVWGMKRAHTIEEYCAVGNELQVVDYPNGRIDPWRVQPFSSEEELFGLIRQIEAAKEFDISFSNNREVSRPNRRVSPNTPDKKESVLDQIKRDRQKKQQPGQQKSRTKKSKKDGPEI